MKTTEKRQRSKVGVAGNLINQLMANNASLPEIGKGATELHYSDRTCYEVIEVSPDGKTVKLEALDAEWDQTKPGGMGHQNWILKPTGRYKTIVWRQGAWRTVQTEYVFTDEFKAKSQKPSAGLNLTPEEKLQVYGDPNSAGYTCWPIRVVPGITREKKTYNVIKILFGVKDYRYDWEF